MRLDVLSTILTILGECDMVELKGIIPYLVSPIKDDGCVDKKELTRLANDLIDQGVHGLCALGSCGEFPYLTREQKVDIVSTVASVAFKAGIPSVAGVCGFSERQAIEEAKLFVSLGVDAIVLMMQSYFPLTDDMIVHFIRSVSAKVPNTQIVLYSNPKYMHFQFSLGVFEGIKDCQNVNYYKDASGNTGFLMSLINKFGSRFKLFSASAHVPLFVFALGGVGWMAGPACVIAKQSVELYNLFNSGRMEEAMALQKKLWDVNRLFAKYDLTSSIKALLRYKGYAVGVPIAPIKDVSNEAYTELCKVLDSIEEA